MGGKARQSLVRFLKPAVAGVAVLAAVAILVPNLFRTAGQRGAGPEHYPGYISNRVWTLSQFADRAWSAGRWRRGTRARRGFDRFAAGLRRKAGIPICVLAVIGAARRST